MIYTFKDPKSLGEFLENIKCSDDLNFFNAFYQKYKTETCKNTKKGLGKYLVNNYRKIDEFLTDKDKEIMKTKLNVDKVKIEFEGNLIIEF